MPEQGGRNLISPDPLPPGSIYTATVGPDGTVGMYRVEVSVAVGNGKLKMAGGVAGATKESVNRAFSYMLAKKGDLSIAMELDSSDLYVEVIDLLNNRVEGEIGLGFFIAAFSALKKAPPTAAMLVLGDLNVQGNIKPVRSLLEPLQVAMDNGAKRALIPLENKRSFLEVTGDVVEHVDPIFFGDAKTAAFKALGMFREKLMRAGALDALFAAFDRQLRTRGYLPMGGQIVDATLVAAPKQRNTAAETAAIKEGKSAAEIWPDQPAKAAQKDVDARWTVKFAKTRPLPGGRPGIDIAIPSFGYKSSIAICRRYGFIRRGKVTDGARFDGRMLRDVVTNDNTASDVWADTAYRTRNRDNQISPTMIEDLVKSLAAEGILNEELAREYGL